MSTLGYGTVAVAENVVYVPAKLGFAFVGIIAGAGSWAVAGGNPKAAKRIWKQALGGDYLITPSMVEGKEPIQFNGPVEQEMAQYRSSEGEAAPTPSPSEGGKPAHRPWWHFWGRKSAANATPTPEPSPTPTPAAGNPESGAQKRHWWRFWGHQAAQAASPTPELSPRP